MMQGCIYLENTKSIENKITYSFPAWELAADTYLLKLQHLQKKVLCAIGNFPRCTPVHSLHISFNLLYVYDYVKKLCKQQAEVIQNRENQHVHSVEEGEARHRKYKRVKLGGSQPYGCPSDKAAIVG
jgi:hypothetical protein